MNVDITLNGKPVDRSYELPCRLIRDVLREAGYEIIVDGKLFEEEK